MEDIFLNKKGVTLLELIIVISIIIILITIFVPAFSFFQKESDLNNTAEEIINTLRLAQSKTLASEGSSQWGVYFDSTAAPHEYILFQGTDYTSRDPAFDETHRLPNKVEFATIDFSGGNELVFNKVSGYTFQAGTVSIQLIADPTKTKSIYLDSTGQITLSSLPIPEDNRIKKDSRHVHFSLDWSIQGATALEFRFPDSGQTEIIEMAPYFNSLKTEFDWDNESSPFVVEGNNQVFRVHTHALDVSSTLLCIHRDRQNGQNEKEVFIYIVDALVYKDIAHYLADDSDTVEKGLYANTMEVQ